MSVVRKAFGHTLIFAAFRGVALAMSLISFPILTRQLSTADYGSLAIINASMTLLAAAAKCGLGMAMLRQYPLLVSDAQKTRTLVGAAFLSTLIVWAVVAAVYLLVVARFVGSVGGLSVLLTSLVTVMAASSALSDLFSALLRARDQVLKSSVFGAVVTACSIAAGLTCVFIFEQKLLAFCLGSLVAELVVLGIAWGSQTVRGELKVGPDTMPFVRTLLAFGMPLVMFEFASIAIGQIDRFQIAHYEGLEAVGYYSVGYNIANYAQSLTVWPMWMALYPIYTRLWETEGSAAVSNFLSSCINALMAVACGIVMLTVLGSQDAVAILASDKFAPAAAVLPVVCAGLMVNGMTHLFGAGFYLKRRTGLLAAIAATGALLKVAVNVVLIPLWGIMGAAVSTVITYLAITVVVAWLGRSMLVVRWSVPRTLIYVAAAALGVWVGMRIHLESPWLQLIARGVVGASVYCGIVLAGDAQLRRFLWSFVRRQLGASAQAPIS